MKGMKTAFYWLASFDLPRRRKARFLPALLAIALFGGCTTASEDFTTPTNVFVPKPDKSQPSPIRFTDVSRAAGVRFKHNNGAFGLKLIAETLGSGCAFLDYNGDGYQDIFLVNGRDWTPQELAQYRNSKRPGHDKPLPVQPPHKKTTSALYRNNRDGTWSDVTRNSGLDVEMMGMGVCVGDYDNDGKSDLYVTGYGRNYLFRNMSTHARGQSRERALFVETARQAGVRDGGWSSSAAWVDYDRDGKLDLFVCHYIQWSPAIDIGYPTEKEASYDGPEPFKGELSRLFHNLGNGRFADVSKQSGIQAATIYSGRADKRAGDPSVRVEPPKTGSALPGKTLGIAVCDYNNDGWPDLALANDTQPTLLFENKRDGTFADVAARVGLAARVTFVAGGGMGIDAADIDHSGRDSLMIAFYSDQMMGLYRNGGGPLQNVAPEAGLGAGGLKSVMFGCVFADFDGDGWSDILTANGHVDDLVHEHRRDLAYAQRPLMFINQGSATAGKGPMRFSEVALNAGALKTPVVGRGLACADIDLDGDLDVLMTSNGGTARLLRNDGGPQASRNRSLRLILQGANSNRDAIGAVVTITVGRDTWRQTVRSGSSYLSQSELPLTIGLGTASRAEKIVVRWPSKMETRLQREPGDQIVTIREGHGVIARQPLRKPSASLSSPVISSPVKSAVP